MAGSDAPESLKQVAKLIADTMTVDGQIIGLGTGVAVNEYIRELSERLQDGRLKAIKCIPSSDVTASEAAFHGVPLTSIADYAGNDLVINVMVDVANELDTENLSYIVGRGENGPQAGQPSLPRLRQLLDYTNLHVAVVERPENCTTRLGGHIPVLIDGDEETWEGTAEELDDIFLGDAEIRRRSLNPEAGPRGGDSPVVTSDGHSVLDIQFYDGLKLFGEDASYKAIQDEIEGVAGVVAHGLVVDKTVFAVVAGKGAEAPTVLQRRVSTTGAEGAE